MTNYKLTYFNVTALGETIRYLFSYAGVEFEDNRIDFEDWPKIKSRKIILIKFLFLLLLSLNKTNKIQFIFNPFIFFIFCF